MLSHHEDLIATAGFFDRAIAEIAILPDRKSIRILDFGCGAGDLANEFLGLGYDAYGCDVFDSEAFSSTGRFRKISREPYRIPFANNEFDIVTSTSVLEHAQNPDEYMPEISRVLRPGGCAMHLLPGKWYLPTEPHIFVPLVNFFWPHCPGWWLSLWAVLGRRNSFQTGMSWRDVAAMNASYCKTGLFYISSSSYERLSRMYFASCEWPFEFQMKYSHGGFASLARKLPFRRFSGWISRECRMGFLIQRKSCNS
jgi:SAM-dependent methyltransferase